MRRIETCIDIQATPEQVWRVLLDFPRYPEWNPFLIRIEGVAEAGARLRIVLQPPGGRVQRFRPGVLQVTPAKALRWLGRLGCRGCSTANTGSFWSRYPAARRASGRRNVFRECWPCCSGAVSSRPRQRALPRLIPLSRHVPNAGIDSRVSARGRFR
ncbi:MAG TPA: SRPBCC domain-containing protein [Gammaproteobacteria bacterium]|nr:SRPBCC domain-containing protein [Gammaproteobacteria bacterium]